jgi:RNA polymerase sigma factor (sigma-70 family)
MFDLEKIVKGCKRQEAESQKNLYQHYFTQMFAICERYAGNKQDAEEMMNNGFYKIFVNINQYEGKGSFEGWMKKIMSNTCLDFFKTKVYKLQQKEVSYLADEKQEQFLESKLFEQGNYYTIEANKKIEKEELVAALQVLPELTKTVFNLIVFEEYSHKEIAEALNIAERTSQWHFSNAKKTLAELLTKNKIGN